MEWARLRALALANARYWPSVAPHARRELERWRAPARQIVDGELRRLALCKLAEERFNAEVAATLATLAPPGERPAAVRAIVALELLFDYLDGRTERPCGDPLGEASVAFAPLCASVSPTPAPEPPGSDGAWADWEYLSALSAATRSELARLPSAGAVATSAALCAQRCAQAQSRIHAAASLGEQQLAQWACEHGRDCGLGWREYAAGGASSVLAMHALIAAAARPGFTAGEAERLASAYLAICAAITILDSLVDSAADRARGEPGFIRLYAPGELRELLPALVSEALARTGEAPDGAHHGMTLAGVVAYYTTHPGAREPGVREIAAAVRAQVSPTIWPTLAVMGCWRAAKRIRGRVSRGALNTAEQAGGARGGTAGVE